MLSFTKADNQPNLSQGIEYTVVPGIEYTVEDVSDYLLSPDGTQVAYIKNYGRVYNCELWVADKVGVELINHVMLRNDAEYNGLDDWQGDWILYRIRREPGGPANTKYGRNELWKMRADGSGDPIQVTHTLTNGIRTEFWLDVYRNRGTAVWGRFIPGTNLVYFQAHNGNGWYKAFVCNDDGTDNWYPISCPRSGIVPSYGRPPMDCTWVLRLSPTGNKLLYGAQWNHYLPTTFKTTNVDGSDKTTIKAFTQKIGVTVLADGNTLVWHQYDNIYAMDMDGTNERTVLDDEYINIMGQWGNYNPLDGQSFLMGSNRATDGNMHVFKMNVDGTGIEQLTEGPYNDEYPILSPDGLYLSYLRLPEDFDKVGYPAPYPYELVIKTLMVYATVDFDPDTLNRKSKGRWVTVYIGLPEGCDANDIEIDSVRLDDELSRADSSPTEITDGILMVYILKEQIQFVLSINI